MSPSEKKFRQAQNAVLVARSAIQKDTHAEVMRLLGVALAEVKTALASAPSEWQAWYLPQLQAEIERVMKTLGLQSARAVDGAASTSWQLGQDFLDKPLAAGGFQVAGLMPHLDSTQLMAMKSFMTDRIQDVSLDAVRKINTELGLTLIGARPMSDTISQVGQILDGASRRRATTIVQTELSRVFSVAADQRATQAVAAGVEMDKVWRRSGKRNPRLSHALADGQCQPMDQPFLVGGEKIMFPHDPRAPAAHTINCGCVMLYRPREWASTLPDHKPFTTAELARNPQLADAVEARATPSARIRR